LLVLDVMTGALIADVLRAFAHSPRLTRKRLAVLLSPDGHLLVMGSRHAYSVPRPTSVVTGSVAWLRPRPTLRDPPAGVFAAWTEEGAISGGQPARSQDDCSPVPIAARHGAAF
jgi:hypothetical protein